MGGSDGRNCTINIAGGGRVAVLEHTIFLFAYFPDTMAGRNYRKDQVVIASKYGY